MSRFKPGTIVWVWFDHFDTKADMGEQLMDCFERYKAKNNGNLPTHIAFGPDFPPSVINAFKQNENAPMIMKVAGVLGTQVRMGEVYNGKDIEA